MWKKIIIVFCEISFSYLLFAQNYAEKIRLNQIGFYPKAPKIAIIPDETGNEFLVKSIATGKVVLRSQLSPVRKTLFSSKTTQVADFSKVKKPGQYVLNLPGKGDSYIFEIKPNVFYGLAKALIKAFYYQRMSMQLSSEFASKWSRAGGHPDTLVFIHPAAASQSRPALMKISSPRGWYDAGDYNKYIVNSGITMGTLLSLYEDFPSFFSTLALNIPESGNGAPDLINEIVWNLRWMITMQDPSDGGVYNKVTNEDFDGFVMPSEAVTPRYIVPKGTAATLDFAAVMAQASRIFNNFRKVFPGLSDSCLKASEIAWKWAINNPEVPYDQDLMNKKFNPDIKTGAYGDNDFKDEFIWAASELYVSTGEESYYNSFPMFPDNLMPLPSWHNVRLLGYYTLARNHKKLKGRAKIDFLILKDRIRETADKMIDGVTERAYMTVMGKSASDFVWGSTSVASNQGILLIQAYLLTKDRKYIDNALTNLDFILGRNSTGYSFVTGYGHKTPMYPHHRLSLADGIPEPIPGLIVGGPNPGQQDECKTYPSRIPDESYTDNDCSFASNEIAINWNAPAAYLAGALEALYDN